MDTVNSNVNINDSSTNTAVDTASSIDTSVNSGGGSEGSSTNTSMYQTNQTGNTYDVEEVDLSLESEPEEEEGFFERIGKSIDSGLSTVGNLISSGASAVGNFVSDAGKAIYDTGAKVVNGVSSWVSDRIADLKGIGATLAETASNVASNVTSLVGALGNWVTKTALPAVGEALVKTGASIGNTITGLLQGVGQFGEALVDTAAIIGTVVASAVTGIMDFGQWIGGKITGNENWHSITKDMWSGTMEFVQKEHVNEAFKKFHEDTPLGKWLDDNAYAPFKSDGAAYKIANGVGYIAGIIALTIVTMGAGSAVAGASSVGATAATGGTAINLGSLATIEITKKSIISGIIAATAGFGKNTEAAWNDGAGLLGGMGYGFAKGLWEGGEMFLGASINSLKLANLGGGAIAQQLATTGCHVALDTIDGASASFIDPLMQMIYNPNETNMEQIMHIVNYDENGNQISNKTWDDLTFSEKYDALFKYNGGWTGVMTAAASAGAMSFLSEIPDIRKAVNGTNTIKTIAATTATGAAAKELTGTAGDGVTAGTTKAIGPSEGTTAAGKEMLDEVETDSAVAAAAKSIDGGEGAQTAAKEMLDEVETDSAVASAAKSIEAPKSDLDLYLEKYLMDPEATPPMGVPKEIIDYLKASEVDPDITAPTGMPQEIVEFIKSKGATVDAAAGMATASEVASTSAKSIDTDAATKQAASSGTDAVESAAAAKKIQPGVPNKAIVEMTEEEIHASIKSEIAQLDPTASDYAHKVAMLQQKEALEIELAKKMSGFVDSSAATKSIDLLDATSQQQAKAAAQEIYDRAVANEASVTASMKKLVDSESTLEGLGFKIKDQDHIEDKIARKVYQGYSVNGAKESINDSLRYTLVVNGDYESTVLSKLKMLQGDGFEIVDLNNAWGGYTYQGLNVTLRNSNGVLVELQFHTPSSFNTKQVINHELYELSRNTSTSKEVRNISDQIQALNQQIYVGSDTTFQYTTASQLRNAVDNFTTASKVFKNYKHANGYDDFLAENQGNIDSWDQAVQKKPSLDKLIDDYKGESYTDPGSYKIANAHLRGTLFDDSRGIVTITGTGGYPYECTYEEFEKMVGCSISEYKLKVDSAISELSEGISQCHLATDTELVRGVNWDTLDYLFGISKYDSIETINAKLAAAGIWKEPGFMSACPSVGNSELPWIAGGKEIRLVMSCEAGIEGRIFPWDYGEKEILLNYGQEFAIKSAEYGADGKLYIYMDHIAK